MPYSRSRKPPVLPSGHDLTSALAGIGINLAVSPSPDADIEPTLVAGSVAGMEEGDVGPFWRQLLAFDLHSARVNADRLIRLVATRAPRVRAFWAALARWKSKDRRFARLAGAYLRPRIDLLATGTAFQISRRGEDPRFAGACLRVPAGVLRDRPGDVQSAAALARRHRAYHWRVIIGPTYRADLWARLERTPTATPYALAAATGASYATAWTTRADLLLLDTASA